MRRSRLIAMLTALLLLGASPAAHAAYTLEQLRVIENFLLSGDLVGLRLYLEQNPSILEGDDDLVLELIAFLDEQQSPLSDFGFSPNDDDDDDNVADPY